MQVTEKIKEPCFIKIIRNGFNNMKLLEKIRNYLRRNASKRTILRTILFIIIFGTTFAVLIVGPIINNQILTTVGIILLTVIITKMGDSFFLAMREHSNKLKKLRAMIGSYLFLFENGYKSLENPLRNIAKYLLDEILPFEEALTKTVHGELKELYALGISISISPSINNQNYADKEFENKSERYKIDDFNRIIDLCKKLKDID